MRDVLNQLPDITVTTDTRQAAYFDFEEDFIENGVRCIPMIVRFKLDAIGIKLKLAEWTRFPVKDREQLAIMPCDTALDQQQYNTCLRQLIEKHTGNSATDLLIDKEPSWANLEAISEELTARAASYGWQLSMQQWQQLNRLQRFVLMKLCRPGHEDKNFPKAMKEFQLV